MVDKCFRVVLDPQPCVHRLFHLQLAVAQLRTLELVLNDLEADVVARADDFWGEIPCAVVTLKEGLQASEQEIIDFCREHLAHFKCPKKVCFAALPKTSTGKIQKFALRDMVRQLAD